MHAASALHEAGHSVVALALGFDLDSVEIFPDGTGFTRLRPPNGSVASPSAGEVEEEKSRFTTRAAQIDALRADPSRFDAMLSEIRVMVGSARLTDYLTMCRSGMAAQMLVTSVDDARLGASDDRVSEDLVLCCFESTRQMMRADHWSRFEADRLVRLHRGAICDVAMALAERKRLSGDDVRAILGERVLSGGPTRVTATASSGNRSALP